MVEKARQNALKERFTRAIREVEHALKREEHKVVQASKQRDKEQRRNRKDEAAAALQKRKDFRLHQQLQKKRWKWMCRADLTIEEIMSGPPRHL